MAEIDGRGLMIVSREAGGGLAFEGRSLAAAVASGPDPVSGRCGPGCGIEDPPQAGCSCGDCREWAGRGPVAAAFMGLMPIMWSTGTGADVMKRIAAPMVGGVITSFILELIVYPAIYAGWKGRHLPERSPASATAEGDVT